MPTYYFHVTIGTSKTRDSLGFNLPDLEEAKAKADAILRVVARENVGAHVMVDVEDDAGVVHQNLIQLQS